jgi:V/A-type H+-transporting ATPase subunit E
MPSANPSSAARLAEAVLAQANEEAERIRQAASAEAGRLIAEAEAEAAERREAIVRTKSAEARRSQRAALALARLEARRALLQAREQLIEGVFARSAEALESGRTGPEYRGLLARLVREAVTALGGESFVLEVGPEDLAVAGEVAASMTTPERAIELRAREGLGGGSIVWRGDRRAFCEKTFSGVLARNKPRLRALVAEWLWGGSAEPSAESGGAASE